MATAISADFDGDDTDDDDTVVSAAAVTTAAVMLYRDDDDTSISGDVCADELHLSLDEDGDDRFIARDDALNNVMTMT